LDVLDRATGSTDTEPAAGVAIDRRCHPYEARWLFAPLFGSFALALALTAVSHLIAFFVWAAGSIATIAIGRWHEAEFERTHPRAALPSATSLPRRDKPRD
jgi:hypothetical protein